MMMMNIEPGRFFIGDPCYVLDLGDVELENSRLCLVNSFKIVLEKSLDLLGIKAPDRM